MSEKLSERLERFEFSDELGNGDFSMILEAAAIVRAVEDAPEGFWCEAMPAYICLPKNWVDIAVRYTDGKRVKLVEA